MQAPPIPTWSSLRISPITLSASSTYASLVRMEAERLSSFGPSLRRWRLPTAVSPISRPLPTDFDAGNFSYKLTAPAYWSLEFVNNGNTYRALQQAVGCESETAAFAVISHDIPGLELTTQTGMKISYKTALGAQSPFGPNFYGTGFAERAFYYRSGYTPAVTAANLIDDYWIRDPELCGGCGGLPLLQGGGAIGGIVDRALNPSTPLTWLDVTPFASAGVGDAGHNCNWDDPRDQGYQQAWLALVALFDPDPARQAAWTTALNRWVTRDQTCRRNAADGYGLNGTKPEQVNSWGGSSLFATTGPALTLTSGSTAATGSGFSPAMCAGQDDGTGTIRVTRGSTAATVVSGTLTPGYRIFITDTSSPIYVGTSEYSVNGASVTLALTWPGDTGTFHFMSEGAGLAGFVTSIGSSNADWPDVSVATGFANNQQLQKIWACKYNNPGSLTLNRPWDGATGSNYHTFSYVVVGFEVQPFMDGVKTSAMNWASQSSNAAIASAYTVMKGQLGTWMATYGVDTNTPGTLGTYYNRLSGNCETAGIPNATTLFDGIHGVNDGCGFMGLAASGAGMGEFTSRVNTAEAYSGLAAYYTARCLLGPSQCSAARALVDKYYGAIYGNCALTAGGGSTFYCDSHYVNTASELSNASLGAYKWSGFFFGMGMAHQWPALRLGGAQPTRNRSVSIAYTLGAAASARILLTAPSGATTTVSCGATSPCAVTVDDRQGSYWYTIQYLSGTGQILSQTDPDLLAAVP